jgi:dienelactone hydrolase
MTGAAAGNLRFEGVDISVTPLASLIDEPIHIRLAGLKRHSIATVRMQAVDAKKRKWHSSARFRADGAGRVDLDRARALSGSYKGVWGMGLIASLTTRAPASGYSFWWNGAQRFTVRVRVRGRTVATTSVRRAVWPVELGRGSPIADETETISETGFYGRYEAPARTDQRAPGILILGGSGGGLGFTLAAATLAGHGYPTLALAYFKEPGLPQTLSNIPLEYFAKALTWLQEQPQVDPSRIVVIGISRGSEAALLLGVHYPDLVQAVVASVPSNVALCSFPGCSGPAWTLNGQPVPYTTQFDQPNPTDDPNAVIPVEQIRGPIFLDCGGVDLIWSSCPYARAIIKRLDAFRVPYRHVLYEFPYAGHYVGALLPYEPAAPRDFDFVADEHGLEKLWPHLLAFLAGL